MIVVLGGGPAGVAAAYRLALRGRPVTLVERTGRVGGNAGSLLVDGIPVDFGSHRLHPAAAPAVLADIRRLLGDDLIDRPRHGRIRLRERWVQFPLRPMDLARHLPPAFLAGVVADVVAKPFQRAPSGAQTFASVLERGLGRTICRDFYFPYAHKIWGLPPDALDPEQARRRVGGRTLSGLVRKVFGGVRRGTGQKGRRFYYPRHGFGQIADAYADAARRAGAVLMLNAAVTSVRVCGSRVRDVEIATETGGTCLSAAHVFSTIPLASLARTIAGADAPPDTSLASRAMVLVYLTLAVDRFTEFDAHYFPEASVRISRLSEPKNYSLAHCPGRTVLCAELPCSTDGVEWSMRDDELAALVRADLDRAGLGPLPEVTRVMTVKLSHAYPIYASGYRDAFDRLDSWVGAIDGLITFGRQGLFVHDNTHHTIAMAYALVDCLGDEGRFDRAAWARARREFEDHVVED